MLRFTCATRYTVGFIGLGQMGARMAPHVLKDAAVTKLMLFDSNPAAVAACVESASKLYPDRAPIAVAAASPAAIAAEARKVVTMLPNGKIVDAVYSDMLPKIQAGSYFVDCSTIDPQTPKSLYKAVMAAGAAGFCDAPVSGGVGGAAAGTLTFMVGSESDNEFAEASSLLATMGKNIVNCGKVGSGQIVKLCNNLVLAQHMVAVSEAMLMGTRLGVAPEAVANVINTSTGKCWSSEKCNPFPGVVADAPASRGYTGGFGAALMLKDIGLAVDAAKSAGMSVEGARTSQKLFAEMVAAGMGTNDFSGVLKHIEKNSAPVQQK
jgi:3-hydroxyisobutyrate dehydrogenase